mmetsp:Transcript_12639/g.18954  ORF Transcript_12639/g.18954 Transcript_12639/m.18954 type:complete len:746 (-) Transcript_12639:2967-5204(-)
MFNSLMNSIPSFFGEDTTRKNMDSILWSNFQAVETGIKYRSGSGKQLYLLIAYNNGFQIFDFTKKNQHINIVSKLGTEVKMLKIIPNPTTRNDNQQQQQLEEYGKHPIVVIATRKRLGQPFSLLMFYSLSTNAYLNTTINCKHEICDIQANEKQLIIATTQKLLFFDTKDLFKDLKHKETNEEQVFPPPSIDIDEANHENLTIYPPTDAYVAMALGARWLAYPTIDNIRDQQMDYSNIQQSLGEISISVAKKGATVLQEYSSLGFKKMSSFMESMVAEEEPGRPVIVEELEEQSQQLQGGVKERTPYYLNSGSIKLVDAITKRTIAHFRSHTQNISAMAFDATGTLLATASDSGNILNLFRIMPSQTGKASKKQFQHLYRLHRGHRNAAIQKIAFSNDSKWIAVASRHGTVHIYGIHPHGGPVTSHTHGVLHPCETSFYCNIQNNLGNLSIVLSTVAKIHTYASSTLKSFTSQNDTPHIPTSLMWMAPSSKEYSKLAQELFILTHDGYLEHHLVTPRDVSFDVETPLEVTTKRLSRQPISREKNDGEYQTGVDWPQNGLTPPKVLPPPSERSKEEQGNMDLWKSNIEIETYRQQDGPIWQQHMFKFKTYQEEIDGSQSVVIQVTEPLSLYKPVTSSKTDIMEAMETPMIPMTSSILRIPSTTTPTDQYDVFTLNPDPESSFQEVNVYSQVNEVDMNQEEVEEEKSNPFDLLEEMISTPKKVKQFDFIETTVESPIKDRTSDPPYP